MKSRRPPVHWQGSTHPPACPGSTHLRRVGENQDLRVGLCAEFLASDEPDCVLDVDGVNHDNTLVHLRQDVSAHVLSRRMLAPVGGTAEEDRPVT